MSGTMGRRPQHSERMINVSEVAAMKITELLAERRRGRSARLRPGWRLLGLPVRPDKSEKRTR